MIAHAASIQTAQAICTTPHRHERNCMHGRFAQGVLYALGGKREDRVGMQAFDLAFGAVAPLFLLMALGYCLRLGKICTIDFFNQVNKLVFKVFLPVMLFSSIYASDFSTAFQPRLLALSVGLVCASWGAAALVMWKAVPDTARRGVIIQGMCRTNYVIFGIPIASSLFGPEHIGVTAVLIAFVVPLYNVFAVLALELNRGGHIEVGEIVRAILTNPLIDATLLAFVAVFTKLTLPGAIESAIADVGGIATSLAIIVIGGTFRFSRVRGNLGALTATLVAKLCLLPVLFVGAGIAMGYQSVELGTLLAMSASPTAISSYPMAREMGGDAELAGQIVVVGTSLSVLTMFLWIFGLSMAGFL